MTPSIEISLFPDHAKDLDALINSADTAMYRSKQAGKNRYVFFESSMLDDVAD